MGSRLGQLLLCMALAASLARSADSKASVVEAVGDQVMCLCGCVATLNHCPHMNCSTKEEMRAVIQKAAAEGKDEKAILQMLAIRYGVQVLAAPPAKGFDLTVWILPGLGLQAGLVAVVIMVHRWRRPSTAPAPPKGPIDPEVLATIAEEMKKVAG